MNNFTRFLMTIYFYWWFNHICLQTHLLSLRKGKNRECETERDRKKEKSIITINTTSSRFHFFFVVYEWKMENRIERTAPQNHLQLDDSWWFLLIIKFIVLYNCNEICRFLFIYSVANHHHQSIIHRLLLLAIGHSTFLLSNCLYVKI